VGLSSGMDDTWPDPIRDKDSRVAAATETHHDFGSDDLELQSEEARARYGALVRFIAMSRRDTRVYCRVRTACTSPFRTPSRARIAQSMSCDRGQRIGPQGHRGTSLMAGPAN
jgi:hypothetical protein